MNYHSYLSLGRSGDPARRGGVFLFCLGMLLVMVALAYTFMASSRIRRDASERLHMLSFAELAANQGAAHVIEVLTREYLSQPGVPTNTNMAYIHAFAPIDTTRVGKHLRSTVAGDAAQYRAQGDPDSAEDENENDVKTEQILTSLYNHTYQGGGTHRARADSFRRGMLLSNGLGRYIEPMHYHTDLVNRPISFHLEHPCAADPTAYDPAVRRGEPWVPDRSDPLYLDSDLQPVSNRAAARFRLRYAVNVEDLSGHLPLSWQGEYDDGASDARIVAPSQTDAAMTAEVNTTIANRYDASLYNMLAIPYRTKAWWGWLVAHGRGFSNWTHPTGTATYQMDRFPVLSTVIGGVPERYSQSNFYQLPVLPDASMTPKPLVTYGHVWTSNRGPVMSAFAGRAFLGHSHDDTPALSYTFTPHGPRRIVAPMPATSLESYTDCPWQLNLPTTVPNAVTLMLYAYLPAEFKSRVYTKRKKWAFTGFNAEGVPQWDDAAIPDETALRIIGKTPAVDLFSSPGFSSNFTHLGSGYPGTDPQDAPALSSVPHWRENLGRHIDLNETGFVATSVEYTHRPPFWGMVQGYLPDLGDDFVEKAETTFVPLGEKWELQLSGAGEMLRLTADQGFAFGDSYYMDLATAFFHSVAVAQLAWMGDNGASSNDFPLDGRPQFPATVTAVDLAGFLADGQPSGTRDRDMLDLDADGDGEVDSPSGFNTIRKVDAQFVRNMGEYFGPKLVDAPNQGLYLVKYRPGSWPHPANRLTRARDFAEAVTFTPSNNIYSLLTDSDPAVKITPEEAALMELVLNDMRMSFFGASPQYPDFQGIDFDNDGTVRCSAYAGGSSPADLDRFGVGPIEHRFSLTGCFVMQKSRYFRAFIRGEIFDELRNVPVETTTLEMVYAIDPSGRIYDVNNQPIDHPTRPRDPDLDGDTRDAEIIDSQVLFQRWHWPKYQTYRPLAAQ